MIVQNFRAKPETALAAHSDPSLEEMLRILSLAQLILGADMNLQALPNLSHDDCPRLLEAGINDRGRISPVTRDFINPEAAWPQTLRLPTEAEARGFILRQRLALYPEYMNREAFVSSRVRERIRCLADGFAIEHSVDPTER